jgi:hypothetical protein
MIKISNMLLLNYAALQNKLLFSFHNKALHDHNNYTTIDTTISSYLNIKFNTLVLSKDRLSFHP